MISKFSHNCGTLKGFPGKHNIWWFNDEILTLKKLHKKVLQISWKMSVQHFAHPQV